MLGLSLGLGLQPNAGLRPSSLHLFLRGKTAAGTYTRLRGKKSTGTYTNLEGKK